MAAALLFMLSLLWDGLLHVVLLADADELMPLSLLLAAALAVVFIWGCARFARDRSLREGALYGPFFALVAGLLVDLKGYLI